MAVSRIGTNTVHLSTSDELAFTFSHSVPPNCDLMLVTFGAQGTAAIASGPKFNGIAMVLVDATTTSGNSADANLWTYAVLSPSQQTNDVTLTWNGNHSAAWFVCTNWSGTVTSSVAAATNTLSEDVNDTASNTSVHASAGSAGNLNYFAGSGAGADMTPISSSSVSDTVIETGDTGGGQNNANDWGYYVSTIAAASAITVTWSATDENTSHYLELVAAAGAGTLTIDNIGPLGINTIFDNELRVVITGEDFGASQGTGFVKLHSSNPDVATPATSVTQSIDSWSATSIQLTVDKGAIPISTVWLEVESNAAAEQAVKDIIVYDDPGAGGVSVRVSPPSQLMDDVGSVISQDMSGYFWAVDVQDALTFSVSGQPSGISMSSAGVYSGTIAANGSDASPYTVTVTCTDTDGNSANDAFSHVIGASVTQTESTGKRGRRRRPRGSFLGLQ